MGSARTTVAMRIIKAFIDDDSGATAIEYAFIAVGIGVAIIPALIILEPKLSAAFTNVAGKL